MTELKWPWAWDDRPHGWRGAKFGPLPPGARASLSREERAAKYAATSESRSQKRQALTLIGSFREKA